MKSCVSNNAGKHFPGGAGSKFAAIVRYVITWWSSAVTIPVYPNAPLLKPGSSNPDGWPLVIFSHGLAGTRNTYSTLCTHLAAQGRIVISMEHRDGTGPAVLPHGKVLHYIAPDDVRRPEDKAQIPLERSAYNSEKALQFRNEQLDFRRREVYETIRSITALKSGGQLESGLQVMDGHEYDYSHWVGHIDVNHIDLVGHSFGGATVVSLNAYVHNRTLKFHVAVIAIECPFAGVQWRETEPTHTGAPDPSVGSLDGTFFWCRSETVYDRLRQRCDISAHGLPIFCNQLRGNRTVTCQF
jgi:dienelactone hydrolase